MAPSFIYFVIVFALMCPFKHSTADELLLTSVDQYCERQGCEAMNALPSGAGESGPRGMPDVKGEMEGVDFNALNTTIAQIFREQTEIFKSMMNEIGQREQRCQALIFRIDARNREIEQELQELRSRVEVPEGWYRARNGLLYRFYRSGKPWESAKDHCREQGAILASSGMRSTAVRRELVDLSEGEPFWFGASDIMSEGQWTWEDGILMRTNNPIWRSGEPNDANEGEDCAYLFHHGRTGLANDGYCSAEIGFMCEKKL